MGALVIDTHVLIWSISDPGMLSPKAKAALELGVVEGAPTYIPSIALVEMTYLVEKDWIPEWSFQKVLATLQNPNANLLIVPLDEAIDLGCHHISRDHVPDRPDRIIAATAHVLGVPLVSRDLRIRGCGIPVVW